MLRGLRTSVWLGWLVESNWTDPFLFVVYSVVRPLAGVLLLYFMFRVLSGGQGGAMLYYFMLGSVLWPYVGYALQGMAFTVVQDREQYHMIRYVYISPVPYSIYLVGRAIARVGTASTAVAITFLFAVAVLGLPLNPAVMDIPYVLVIFPVGFIGMWALGMATAGLAMNFTQQAWSMPDAIGGALYLLCGAIFPITQLPPLLQAIGALMPMSYWLEGMRRGLLGPGVSSFPDLSDQQVLQRLIVTTIIGCLVGYVAFRAGERRAKGSGNLDRTSNY
jgi:ABC-2 type transport system permease protein